MATDKEPELALIFRRFHPLLPDIEVSFCSVYERGAAETGVLLETEFRDWPEHMIYHAPLRRGEGRSIPPALKLYFPGMPYKDIAEEAAAAEGVAINLVFFAVVATGEEDFFELTLHKTKKDARAVCYRGREYVRENNGALVEEAPALFGFSLPHPPHPRRLTADDPNYMCLIEHQPGTTNWPGFEPVWVKVGSTDGANARYFRIDLLWTEPEEDRNAAIAAVEYAEDSEAIPTALKECNASPR